MNSRERVLSTLAHIEPDVPLQNIIAMFNAVKEFNGGNQIKIN
jgi:hypothetical protein